VVVFTEYLLKLVGLRISYKVSQNFQISAYSPVFKIVWISSHHSQAPPLMMSLYTRLVVDIIILAAKTIPKKRQPEAGNVRSNRRLVCKWKSQMVSWGWRGEEETRQPPLPPRPHHLDYFQYSKLQEQMDVSLKWPEISSYLASVGVAWG
jgi:hypothetical protein